MSKNGRGQGRPLVAEIVIRWHPGADAPHYLGMPKHIGAATIVGMLEWAKKGVQEQKVGAEHEPLIVRP